MRLKKKWSPQQISNRLIKDFPAVPETRVCPETIYQAIYVHAKGELRRELSSQLRRGRTARRPRRHESGPSGIGLVYFADPGAPWQRGTNENTNGLLRQYFPRGVDLSSKTIQDLQNVATELNDRPRKALDWDTPAERWAQLLCAT